jgi:peptide/nickel transport system substrate-binding protein
VKNKFSLMLMLLVVLALLVAPAFGQELKDVPRNRTLILDCAESGICAGQLKDWNIFNPYLPNTAARTGYNFMLEPLYFYNAYTPNPDEAVIPWIATGHEYNEDFTEVTVNIREGVEWSDGTPWTANDLVFTINMLKDNAPDLSFSIDMRTQVAEAVAVDDLTARITLNAPNPRFIFAYFTHNFDNGIPIVPAHIWEGQNPLEFTFYDEAQGWPVYTGPYTMSFSSPEQRIWDVREDWWAAKIGFHDLPQVERVIYLPYFDENKRVQSVLTNEIDSSLDLRPTNIIAAVNGNPNVSTFANRELPYGYVDWWPISLGFNNLEEPFSDPEIRWAVNYAIDRDQLVQIGYQGAGIPTLLPFPQFGPLQPYQDAIQDIVDASGIATHDPALTDEIMTSKGWEKDGEGFWTKDGERLSFTIEIFSIFQDITPVLVQQLRNAGFDVSFRMQSDSYSRMSLGEAPAFLFGNGGSVRDPWKTLGNYHSRHLQPTGTATGNFWRYDNAEFDAIVDQMAAMSPDDPALVDLYREAMTIYLDELPAIPIVQWFHRIPHNETYWTNWPTVDNPYINSAYWHRTWLLVLLGLEPTQ